MKKPKARKSVQNAGEWEEKWQQEFYEKFELDGDILGPINNDGSRDNLTMEDIEEFIKSLLSHQLETISKEVEEMKIDGIINVPTSYGSVTKASSEEEDIAYNKALSDVLSILKKMKG